MPIKVGNAATVNKAAFQSQGVLNGLQVGFQMAKEIEDRKRQRERDARGDYEFDQGFELNSRVADARIEQTDRSQDFAESTYADSKARQDEQDKISKRQRRRSNKENAEDRAYQGKVQEQTLESNELTNESKKLTIEQQKQALADNAAAKIIYEQHMDKMRGMAVKGLTTAVKSGAIDGEQAMMYETMISNIQDPEQLFDVYQTIQEDRAIFHEKNGEMQTRAQRAELWEPMITGIFGDDKSAAAEVWVAFEDWMGATPEKHGRGGWTEAGHKAYQNFKKVLDQAEEKRFGVRREAEAAYYKKQAEQHAEDGRPMPTIATPAAGNSGEAREPGKITTAEERFAANAMQGQDAAAQNIVSTIQDTPGEQEQEEVAISMVNQLAGAANWTDEQRAAAAELLLKMAREAPTKPRPLGVGGPRPGGPPPNASLSDVLAAEDGPAR